MENTCSDKNSLIAPLIAPPSSASQEHEIQITEDEVPHNDSRRIHRVPHHLKNENEEDYYTPKFFSLGPYHHGAEELRIAEESKPGALNILLSGSGSELTKEDLENEISKVIDKVRNCYDEIPYDDRTLTEMMVRDSCFFLCLLKMMYSEEQRGELQGAFIKHLGIYASSYIGQDMYLLENQIPFWVISRLLRLIDKEDGSKLLCRFLSERTFGDFSLKSMPEKSQPLHLLDACRILVLPMPSDKPNEDDKPEDGQTKFEKLTIQFRSATNRLLDACRMLFLPKPSDKPNEFQRLNIQFRSVTDLKAKGIFLKPSSYCLMDIKFDSYGVFAILRLPRLVFTNNSKRYFLNMIAHETSPGSSAGWETISYLIFLKSLLNKPEDVRELREKDILFCSLDRDEQVLQIIKEIDTLGLNYRRTFAQVKDRIEGHCRSWVRTSIAEFYNKYFRSPWAFIALVAIIFQLCLSVISTYYAIH